MSYCNLCENLTVARLFPPNIYHHAENISVLIESGTECQLCAMLLRAVIAAQKIDDPEYSTIFRGLPENDPLLVRASDEMSDCENEKKDNRWNMGPEDTADDHSGVKLQILEETQRRYSTINLDGFTHIGIWTRSRRILSSLTLMVQEGESGCFATIFD